MISIKHLRKSFNGVAVLRDVNLRIDRGATLVVIGASGCGKSVLLKLIIGILEADGGAILVDGEDIVTSDRDRLFRIRRKFGMLFQSSALFDSMTVSENLALAAREHAFFTESELRDRIQHRLELVGLPDAAGLLPAELSGGMKKRAALARALMLDPEYVLYDEPTTGLDPIMADAINRQILQCAEQLGVTSIVVTHDIHSAYKVADTIAMLHEGAIIACGTPEEIGSSSDTVVRRFISIGTH